MRFLDRLIRLVLLLCMGMLSGYILIRTITIAGENGLFQHTPLLSALYRKMAEVSMETVVPALFAETERSPQEELIVMAEKTISPWIFYVNRQQEYGAWEWKEEEYELILEAEAQAEEEKNPLNLEEWTKQQKEEKRQEEYDAVQEETQEQTTQDREQEFLSLLNAYFSMDAATTIDSSRLNAGLMDLKLALDPTIEGPQILIYHSHSQEAFVDSEEGDDTTTIVGVGDYLTELLTEKYGYEVIHDRGIYDLIDGVLDRNVAYDYAGEAVESWLARYPQIQVIIDLHRDGVDGKKFVMEYEGKPTANLMFILGMSQNAQHQDIAYLPNPYIKENIAFALQLQKKAENIAPGLMRNIYLMAYRFNLHYRPKSILLEAGTQLNTLEEEKNAMEVFAQILDQQLKAGKS